MGKILEEIFYHTLHQFFQCRVSTTVYLQQQALLEAARPNACGFKLLQHRQHLFYFARRHVDIMIHGQLVADGMELLTKQTVIIERTNQILHDILLTLRHIDFTHLFFQLVVKRNRLAIDHLLALFCRGATTMVNGQILIVAPHITKSLIKGGLTLLTLILRLEIFRAILSIRIVRIARDTIIVFPWGSGLQGRVIVHLGIDTIYQLHERQFYKRCLQQLLMGDCLSQLLLLCQFLYLTIFISHHLLCFFNS